MDIGKLRSRRVQILELAQRYGARKLRVFGSTARGESDASSDVDLLVELESGRSLLDLGGLQMDLTELLGCRVDVLTEKALAPRIRDRVLSEAQPL